MSRLAEAKRHLRDRSEHYLLQDAAARLGKGVPGTYKPYRGTRRACCGGCSSSRSTGACPGA